MPERPGQPAVFKDLAEALGQWHQQQTALGQQQVTLQKQTLSLQHLAMKQIEEEPEQKKAKAAPHGTAAGCNEGAVSNGHATGEGSVTATG